MDETVSIPIIGKNRRVKDQLKTIGCIWDPGNKCWTASTEEMAMKARAIIEAGTIQIIGNTWPVRKQLKDIGCRWDYVNNCCVAPTEEIATKAKAIVEANEIKLEQERALLKQIGGVLPALFSINREAKRQRDFARDAHDNGNHSDGAGHTAKKRWLYEIKGQVLERAVKDGLLTRVGWHRFGENYAEVLAGGGYKFHRPAPPPKEMSIVEELKEIDSKPVGANEVPIEIAERAVAAYLQGRRWVKLYEWPRRDWAQDECQDDSW